MDELLAHEWNPIGVQTGEEALELGEYGNYAMDIADRALRSHPRGVFDALRRLRIHQIGLDENDFNDDRVAVLIWTCGRDYRLD